MNWTKTVDIDVLELLAFLDGRRHGFTGDGQQLLWAAPIAGVTAAITFVMYDWVCSDDPRSTSTCRDFATLSSVIFFPIGVLGIWCSIKSGH